MIDCRKLDISEKGETSQEDKMAEKKKKGSYLSKGAKLVDEKKEAVRTNNATLSLE